MTNRRGDAVAHRLEEDQQRDEGVAGDHDPEWQGVVAGRAVGEDRLLEDVARVPGDEELDAVGVAHDQRGHQQQLGHRLEVEGPDDVRDAECLAQRDQDDDDHGQAGEDGAGDEVGGEDGRVPAGHDAHGEVPGDDRVHRDDQRRGQAGEEDVGRHVVLPLADRAEPAQRSDRQQPLLRSGRRAVAQRRDIGDQPDEEEDQADREVGADGEHVPHQRRAEVGPQLPAVGDTAACSRRPTGGRCGSAGRARPWRRRRWSRPRRRGRSPSARERAAGRGSREIRVPAWPMPTQKTKLVMNEPQPTGLFSPVTPMPVLHQVDPAAAADGDQHEAEQRAAPSRSDRAGRGSPGCPG